MIGQFPLGIYLLSEPMRGEELACAQVEQDCTFSRTPENNFNRLLRLGYWSENMYL